MTDNNFSRKQNDKGETEIISSLDLQKQCAKQMAVKIRLLEHQYQLHLVGDKCGNVVFINEQGDRVHTLAETIITVKEKQNG